MREESSTPVRALYDVPEAMALLNLSRTQIYELIRTRRLVTVTQGRRRLVPADSISEYVQLLLTEAGGIWSRGVAEVKAACFGMRSVSGGSVSSRRATPPAGNVVRPG